jgi:molybdate transport system substrate-binding protein
MHLTIDYLLDNLKHSRNTLLSRATFRAFRHRGGIRSIAIFAVVAVGLAGAAMAMERSRSPVAPTGARTRILVFAASSLTDAMPDLTEAFEKTNPDLHVDVNFAASSRLALQIREGMPADVFVSAGQAPMARAQESGRIDPTSVTTVAGNRLLLITPADNPAGIREVADIGTKRMALTVAAPGVPAREYTDKMVHKVTATGAYGEAFLERYARNIASEENNVRQVAARVAMGEADAGVVYATDLTPEIRERVLAFPVPATYGVKAEYVTGTLGDSKRLDSARAFQEFLLSDSAATILADHGFTPVAEQDGQEQREWLRS